MSDQERPQPPGASECCEGGCSPCVWDTYYEELEAWQAAYLAQKKENESE